MAEQEITQIISRIFGYILVAFMTYMLFKFYSRKKMSKHNKMGSWVIGTVMVLIGLGGLFISFFLFSNQATPLFWKIVLPLFSLAFVISGILVILVGEGKINRKI
ncbi:MAG: hypothetical protein ABIH34_02920 [Nanoarchaeota archaeon]